MAGGRKRLKQALDSSLNKKQDKLKLIPAMCGAYLNGQKTLQVSGRDDYIWVRMRGSTSEVVRAFNDAVTPHWDLPVLIYRDPNVPDIWKVYGRDITRYEDWGDVSYLPRHAGQHSFAHGNYGSDVVWVYKRQFMPMLSHPQATATMSVYIDPDFYHWDGAYNWWPGSGTVDMTSYKPTGANNAKFVTVALDGYTGNLLYIEGPEFDAIWVPTNPAEYISAPTPTQGIPLVAVLLMTGTSSLGWAELYDIRNIVSPIAATGAFTAEDVIFPYDNIGVWNWDNGAPQGTGTTIDWGNNLDISLSGTVLRVDATVTGSVSIYENEIFKATATILDFQNNLDVTVSGSTVFINATTSGGGGGGGGGIVAWDDGVYIGTGTIIDFGANLNVTASGTVFLVTGQAGGGGTPATTTTGTFYLEEVLYDVTLASATGSIVVPNISQKYDHLRLVLNGRSTQAAVAEGSYIFFNGDTTLANYRYAQKYAGTSEGIAVADNPTWTNITAASALTRDFSMVEARVDDYAITGTYNKQLLSWEGERHSATNIYVRMLVVYWESPAAITRIDIKPILGSWAAKTRFQVIGIKKTVVVTGVSGGGGGGLVTGSVDVYDDSVLVVEAAGISFDDGLDVSASGSIVFVNVATADTWHWIGSGTSPSFQDSWVNYGAIYPGARYIKDAACVVHIEGLIKSGLVGTARTVFTLPVGYRPTAGAIEMAIWAVEVFGGLEIHTDGRVCPRNGGNSYFSIACSFYVG